MAEETTTKKSTRSRARKSGSRSRPRKTQTQTVPPTSSEGQRFEQVIDGQVFIMEIKDGSPKIIEKKQLSERKERTFRLRPIPHRTKQRQRNKRYHFNPGPGQKVLRFYQSNVEGEERDPAKENCITVNKDIARQLASMPTIFEEIFDE